MPNQRVEVVHWLIILRFFRSGLPSSTHLITSTPTPNMALLAVRLVWTAVLLCTLVMADTEIRNFQLPLAPSSPTEAPSLSTRLTEVSTGSTSFNVTDQEPELWLLWHAEADQTNTRWTVRLSWPGSVRLSSPFLALGISLHLLTGFIVTN